MVNITGWTFSAGFHTRFDEDGIEIRTTIHVGDGWKFRRAQYIKADIITLAVLVTTISRQIKAMLKELATEPLEQAQRSYKKEIKAMLKDLAADAG